MKKELLIFLLAFFNVSSFGQAYHILDANRISTGMYADGKFFANEDFDAHGYFLDYDFFNDSAGTILISNIWVAGIDQNGEYKASVQTYGNQPSKRYSVGPFNGDQLNIDFNRVAKIRGGELRAFREDWADGTLDSPIPNAIEAWPARANSFLIDFPDQDMAPFFDADGDNKYDPSKGDFPIIGEGFENVIPEQMLFSLYSDRDFENRVGLEIQTILYVLDCDQQSELLDRSIFSRHVIKNINQFYSEFNVGIWTDFDLGCFDDDFHGCIPEERLIFSYNQDPVDGHIGIECSGGWAFFEDNVPVQATRFLNQELSSYLVYDTPQVDGPPAMNSPNHPREYFNFTEGQWRDETPITIGGRGYNPGSTDTTFYSYHDLPSLEDGWSMYQIDAPFLSNLSIGSSHFEDINPNDRVVLDLVHFTTEDENYSHYEKVDIALEESKDLQGVYNNLIDFPCSAFSSTEEVNYEKSFLYPNPTSGNLSWTSELVFSEYVIRNAQGQKVASGILQFGESEISLRNLTSGMYFVEMIHAKGRLSANVVLH